MTEIVLLGGARIVEPAVGVGPLTTVALESDRVAAIGDRAADSAGQVVDLEGLWLVPGLIDLQVNGAAGHDTTDDPSTIWAVGEAIAATGVTAFLPTIITAPEGRIDDALAIVAAVLTPWLPPGIPALAAALVAVIVGLTYWLGRRETPLDDPPLTDPALQDPR